MSSSPPATTASPGHYRLAVASRCVAAIVGGYVVSALCAALLALLLPLVRVEAVLASTMLSFAIYTVIVMWAFYEASLRRVWMALAGASAALGILTYLLSSAVGAST